MGRYLAAGVPSYIKVVVRYKTYDIKKEMNSILKEIGKRIDISKFDISEYDDGLILNIKHDYFEDNIHNLVKEFDKIAPCLNSYIYDMGLTIEDNDYYKDCILITSEDFNKENYSIIIDEEIDDSWGNGKKHLNNDVAYFQAFNYLLLKSLDIDWRDFNVTVAFYKIWRDDDKYCGEDETIMLDLLIKFSRNYFKNELGNSLLFYISG